VPSAGEVEQYGYCAHNWFLARQGRSGKGEGSDRGIEKHAALGRVQASIERQKSEYRSGLAWSFRVLAFSGSISFLGLELVLLRQNPYHLLFLTIALFLVSISAALMAVALDAQNKYRKQQRAQGIVPGHLLDSDLAGAGRTMEDPAWGITGRPDYVLQTEHGPVPVEVKTGRTPKSPFPSHALQVGCYLRLLEVETGKAPDYGLLNYPDGVFRIAWDDKLRADLQATLAKIKQAETTGKADRDHDQPGRCRGCSRRDACEQKLA